MFDRSLGQDSMAEVENVGSSLEAPKHAIDPLVQPETARDQREGIEIALQRNRAGHGGDGGPRVHRRVEADRGEAGDVDEIAEFASPPRAERR